MPKTRLPLVVAALALAACTSYKVDPGDPQNCLAGEVWDELQGKCVSAGCSQDIHCDDGNPCNGVEECIQGRCSRGGVIVESCDDGVDCTRDFCDMVLAECAHEVRDELCEDWEQCDPEVGCVGRMCSSDQFCSDGLYCNGEEKCSDGKCLAGRLDCDDAVACTQDSCNEEADGCQHVPDHQACPPGEICNPDRGCVEKPCGSDGDCDDGSYCNGEEKCSAGKCIGGLAVNCSDGVDCTVDGCDESSDQCVNKPEDRLCDDELYCNGNETCDANSGCKEGVPVDCADVVDCTVDSCNEEEDACQHRPDDGRCAHGEFCDSTSGCVPQSWCENNDDCPGGMKCIGNKCITVTEEPHPLDAGNDGDDGGTPGDDGMPGDDGYGDDGGVPGDDGMPGDDGGMPGDDGGMPGDDGGMPGDDGGMPGDDGGVPGDDGMPGDDGGDEGCQTGDFRECDTGLKGECRLGTQYCSSGVWSPCEQLVFPVEEICDGLDNNCNGIPDDGEICACLTGCENLAVCDLMGNQQCEHIPGYMTVCIQHCMGSDSCTSTAEGLPQVCVDVPEFALGPVCMCEPGTCPQECLEDHDCYPYGLTFCDVDFKCRGNCASNLNCPPPYICEQTEGVCNCDSGNIGLSCLACDLDTDCHLGAPCSYRDSEPATTRMFKECQYDCTKKAECPQTQYGDKLYCHWGGGNLPNRCACAPELPCQECHNMDPDPCQQFWMTCMTLSGPAGGEIVGCTTQCQSDDQCPLGWFCWDDGLSTHGWCIEQGCNCSDVECGPDGIPAVECPMTFPGFECITDTTQDPPVELCTKYCNMHAECPLGYWCDTGGGATAPICRCNPGYSP
jgi:hypothetical protein